MSSNSTSGEYQYFFNGTQPGIILSEEQHVKLAEIAKKEKGNPDDYINQLKAIEQKWIRKAAGKSFKLREGDEDGYQYILNIIWLVENGYMKNDDMNGYLYTCSASELFRL